MYCYHYGGYDRGGHNPDATGEIPIRIIYKNGTARDGCLDMYDAAVSMQGFARALAITGHAILNKGEIRKRADRVEGGRLLIYPPRAGSFEEVIAFVVNNPIMQNVVATAFWDLLKWAWARVVGLGRQENRNINIGEQTRDLLGVGDNLDLFGDEICHSLESPIKQAHHPIKRDGNMVVVIANDVARVLVLNSVTLDNMMQTTETEHVVVRGNVTRYNILSGFGRLYDDALGRTVSFKVLDAVPPEERKLLTASIHYANIDRGGKISFEVTKVISGDGSIKRYHVHRVYT